MSARTLNIFSFKSLQNGSILKVFLEVIFATLLFFSPSIILNLDNRMILPSEFPSFFKVFLNNESLMLLCCSLNEVLLLPQPNRTFVRLAPRREVFKTETWSSHREGQ